MRAFVWLDDGMSGLFAVEQGLREGWVLALLLFNILFVAVIYVAYNTRFKAEKDTTDALVHLGRKRGRGGQGEAAAREPALATPLWGMTHAYHARAISLSPEKMRRMMGVSVVLGVAFGLTVSEVKTEIMCLRTKGMPQATTIFSVEVAGQVNNQKQEFVYLEGNVNHNANLSIEVDRCIRNAPCRFRQYTLEMYDRPSGPLELKIWMLRADVPETMLCDCGTYSPRACQYDTLRQAHHSIRTRCIGCR